MAETRTIALSLLVHTNLTPPRVSPCAFLAVATNCSDAPSATRVGLAGVTSTEAIAPPGLTVTTALPETAPALAVTVAEPRAMAVTIPVVETRPIAVSLAAHTKSGPTIMFPAESATVATSWTVAPIAVSVGLGGVTRTETTTRDWVVLSLLQ